MRMAIYGAGAMGTVLGAFVTRAGNEIDLVTRNAGHVCAMKKHGAKIVGTVEFTVPVSALTPDEMSGKYDLIFLMTKQRNNREICEFLSDYLSENGAVCTLQNGLPEPSVAAVIGEERTMGCAVSWGATFRGDGVAEVTSQPDKFTFSLGAYNPAHPMLPTVKAILESMGEVETEENFIGARWAKLAVNSAFSSVSAVTGLTFGEVAARRDIKPIALGLLNEAFAVAESCGVKISSIQGHNIVRIYGYSNRVKRFIALALLPLAMKSHKNLVSGMYFDLKQNKKSDIDYINGIVVHAAKNFGVPTPINRAVLDLAHSIERGEREVSEDNIKFLKV